MHRVFDGRVDVPRPISEHPTAAVISCPDLSSPMCLDEWIREKRSSFGYWLWKRKWSTISEERLEEIISEIAPNYAVKFIAFKSSGSDGIVRRKDALEVYVVNNGGMSYCDLAFFCGEMRCAMNRDAYFHTKGRRTERSELEEHGLTIAYEGPVKSDTGRSRSKDEASGDPVQSVSAAGACQAGPEADDVKKDTSPIFRFDDPPGINPGLIGRAVDTVVEKCSPRLVYLVGPTTVGYVEQGRVELVVIVDKGNKKTLQSDITRALTD